MHACLLHCMCVQLRNGYTQAYAQIMQHTHTHKAVTGHIEAKKLLSHEGNQTIVTTHQHIPTSYFTHIFCYSGQARLPGNQEKKKTVSACIPHTHSNTWSSLQKSILDTLVKWDIIISWIAVAVPGGQGAFVPYPPLSATCQRLWPLLPPVQRKNLQKSAIFWIFF